jgi:TRAP-type C4-dicarboxylate transport system substrate-binding protein
MDENPDSSLKRKEVRMKRSRRFLALFLGLGFFFVGTSNGLLAEEITYTGPPLTIRFSSHVSDTHLVWQRATIPWMRLVEKESKGKLIIKPYTSGALHGAKDGFKACVADITDTTHGYPLWQPASFDLFHVLDLPFAFPNVYVSALVSEELYPKYLKKEYEKMGVYLANCHTISPYHLLSKKPIRKIEDLKGMKVRSGGGSVAEMVRRLGAVPVLITTAEVYSAFQRGTVDAVLLYDSGFTSFRLHEIGKYRTVLGLNLAATPYCLNRKTFDGLPKDLKRLFYNLERINSQMAAEGYDYADKQALDIMRKAGIETIVLPPAELGRWKTAVEFLWEEFISKNEAKGLPAKELVNNLRTLSAKYFTWTPDQIMMHVKENPIPGIIDGM